MKTSNFFNIFIETQKILPLQLRNKCSHLQMVIKSAFYNHATFLWIPIFLTTSYFVKWSVCQCHKCRVLTNGLSVSFGDVVYGWSLILLKTSKFFYIFIETQKILPLQLRNKCSHLQMAIKSAFYNHPTFLWIPIFLTIFDDVIFCQMVCLSMS